MKILLAGYNIDIDLIQMAKEVGVPAEQLTPETISAAYARISRSPDMVHILRRKAREELEKARKSNKNIIFNMGHHSVAEHSIFNFDIIGISRLAVESIENFRLSSYTEKSQRYIKLANDFVIPEEIAEIKENSLKNDFISMIQRQNAFYHHSCSIIEKSLYQITKADKDSKKVKRFIKGRAREDARYIAALATESQLGMTINARNLELLFRRFASHPLKEIQTIGEKMYARIENIAPSIILFCEANTYDRDTYKELKQISLEYFTNTKSNIHEETVKLVNYTKEGDILILTSLLHTISSKPFNECQRIVENMSLEEKIKIIKTANQYLSFYDAVLREYEHINLTFELIVSSACFAQLKRHRMATITKQEYSIDLDVTVPESIISAGLEGEFRSIIEDTNKLYKRIYDFNPNIASYILTNAHRRRVLIRVNARELYHIARLREDKDAQWDIRQIAMKMSKLAKEVMPLSMQLLCGKDKYTEKYQKIYDKSPLFH